MKGAGERNIILGAGLNVYFLDETRVRDHLIPVNTIHQRFCESNLPDARHVKSVNIVPPGNLVILVLPVLYPTHVQSSFVRKHQTSFCQPLRDDYVNLVHTSRQLDFLHLSPDDCDGVTQAIVLDNLLGMIYYRAHVDTNHLSSSSFSSKHG